MAEFQKALGCADSEDGQQPGLHANLEKCLLENGLGVVAMITRGLLWGWHGIHWSDSDCRMEEQTIDWLRNGVGLWRSVSTTSQSQAGSLQNIIFQHEMNKEN